MFFKIAFLARASMRRGDWWRFIVDLPFILDPERRITSSLSQKYYLNFNTILKRGRRSVVRLIRRKIVFIALKEWVEDARESHASRVSLACPVLSCAHHFQVRATCRLLFRRLKHTGLQSIFGKHGPLKKGKKRVNNSYSVWTLLQWSPLFLSSVGKASSQ